MSECYSFVVNGVPCSTEEEKPLLRYLRDELRLTSVKDGCSEGACGTCTVLIDGKPIKACVPQTDKLEGKSVITVEGLSDWEKQVYTWAFGEAGAVQCGFCIPGFILTATEIVNAGKEYTDDELRKLLSGHLCRCTGYENILRAVIKTMYRRLGLPLRTEPVA